MPADPKSPEDIAKFIARWSHAEASERANCQPFLSELCDILGVSRPDPAGTDTKTKAYVSERAVTFHHRGSTKTTTGRIDVYRRDCFVLEAKQYAAAKPSAPAELTKQFTRAKESEVLEILDTLFALVRAHPGDTQGHSYGRTQTWGLAVVW